MSHWCFCLPGVLPEPPCEAPITSSALVSFMETKSLQNRCLGVKNKNMFAPFYFIDPVLRQAVGEAVPMSTAVLLINLSE